MHEDLGGEKELSLLSKAFFVIVFALGGGKLKEHLEGFQQMDHIGEREQPGRSIFTFSSPFLFRMLIIPLNIPRARY